MMQYKISDLENGVCEMRRQFEFIKPDWIDLLSWSSPHKVEMLVSNQKTGVRNNNHIVNPHHMLSRRAFVSGFMEGNTSSTRQWGLLETGDEDLNKYPEVKEFSQRLTRKVFNSLSTSNIYRHLPVTYEDISTVNTAVLYIDELPDKLHYTPLDAGTYFLENDYKGDAVVLVRQFQLSVRQLVHAYGKKTNGNWDWSNFSKDVRKFYEDGRYHEMIDVVEWCGRNEFFDVNDSPAGVNRPWVCLTYELDYKGDYTNSYQSIKATRKGEDDSRFLRIQHRMSKPFVAPKNISSNNFAYGQTGCMLEALGAIKSLNKKAIVRDTNLDFMSETAIQGMAGLKKSYRSNQAGTHLPMSIYEQQQLQQQQQLQLARANSTGYQLLTQDSRELEQLIDRLFYADYLLFMVNNPKTRTAREVDVIEQEKQLIAGPLLQSLDHSLNVPLLEYNAEYILRTDPTMVVPEALAGKSLQVKITSVFAQVQRAADLPQVDRFVQVMANLAQVNPQILQKINFDKYADIYEDRLYLPAGLNRDQESVDSQREMQQQAAMREQQLQQAAVAATAAKDAASAQYDRAATQGDYGQ